MGICDHCGAPIEEGARSCAYCGLPVVQPEPAQIPAVYAPQPQSFRQAETAPSPIGNTASGREKNKWVAFLLCLFFGVIGVHKFYEGRIGLGILYLLTGGLFGIGWFVDLILLLFKPNPYFL